MQRNEASSTILRPIDVMVLSPFQSIIVVSKPSPRKIDLTHKSDLTASSLRERLNILTKLVIKLHQTCQKLAQKSVSRLLYGLH